MDGKLKIYYHKGGSDGMISIYLFPVMHQVIASLVVMRNSRLG
jgi:hypothetical protein